MTSQAPEFSLLEGKFTAEEAKTVLRLLTDAKLRYHTDRIIHSKSETEILQSKNRIHALKEHLQKMISTIDKEVQPDMFVALHSQVRLELLPSESAHPLK